MEETTANPETIANPENTTTIQQQINNCILYCDITSNDIYVGNELFVICKVTFTNIDNDRDDFIRYALHSTKLENITEIIAQKYKKHKKHNRYNIKIVQFRNTPTSIILYDPSTDVIVHNNLVIWYQTIPESSHPPPNVE